MTARQLRFQPGGRMVLLVLLVLPVLLWLGTWQLERAEEKRRYESAYLELQGMLPVVPPVDSAGIAFSRVKLIGHYDSSRQVLLDNQVSSGRVGYWVITRFQAEDGRSWLVNRGWVAAPGRREQLPDVRVSEQPGELVAVIWPDTGLVPLLKQELWPAGWPKRVQRLDIHTLGPLLGSEAVEMRAEAGQPGVLEAAPLLIPVTHEKHTGYAVQWFLLAGVLLVGFVLYGISMSTRRKRETGSDDGRED
jgi:surfeit locus 1 family protein